MRTFAQIIQDLSAYWSSKGCTLHLGHDVEVGAGTFNPATFLRCLGPEPYSAAYVEPSRRPSDGRYGKNPNRVQLFHQFQVLIKPSPENIIELYLESLDAIGLDRKKHDIRFVEDDWENPTVGAHGLGWEVWIDGMEISQFTYMQAVGSLPLKPISAEVTYGLERLVLFIQGVDSIFDIQWSEGQTFREISHESEVEWSVYNFEEANTKMWASHFNDYEKEALSLIEKNLPLPAYDFVMKASHAFNLLDARGVISTTERTEYIGRIRSLARKIASAYIEMREKIGHPLLKEKKEREKTTLKAPLFDPTKTEDFLLEVGVEPLPASFVEIGREKLEEKVTRLLQEHHIAFEKIESFGTPRRLALSIQGLSMGTLPSTQERRGPAVETAFQSDGTLSPQGMGFFKGCNLEPVKRDAIAKNSHLEIREVKGKEYLFAHVTKEGLVTAELLQKELPTLILSISFPKSMRWAHFDYTFGRPIRWIVALLGKEIIPFHIGDVESGNLSRGHAQRSSVTIPLSHPSDYLKQMQKHFVEPSFEKRKERIAKELGESRHEFLLNEVANLTEWPEVCTLSFDKRFLAIPEKIVTSEMVDHQRYFPIMGKKGLEAQCLCVCDNQVNPTIIKGNENVLTARLSDGEFLFTQDIKTPLEDFAKKLRHITLHQKLGTLYDKVERLKTLALALNEYFELDPKTIERGATLCKADLSTTVVFEFPHLQGYIGKKIAEHQKEREEIATAIEEHWMPLSEKGELPQTKLGTLLSFADKCDSLLGYFAIDLIPTSSSDPHALKRAAFGIINMLIENGLSFSLRSFFDASTSLYPDKKELVDEVMRFLTDRTRYVLVEKGFAKEEVEAVLTSDPLDALKKVEALHAFRKTDPFTKLFEVYKRAKGQIGKEKPHSFSEALLKEEAEKNLTKILSQVEKEMAICVKEKEYQEAFALLAKLQAPLATLFDEVHILAEKKEIRENRVALLQKVFSLFSTLLDFGKL